MQNEVFVRNRLLKKTGKKTLDSGLDALLISDQHDMFYLTGFFSAGNIILLPVKGRPVYLVDSMNNDLARKMLEGMDLDIAPGPATQGLIKCIRDMGIRRLGIDEDNLPASIYRRLSGADRKLKLRSAPDIIGDMRAIKEQPEIAIIRKAAKETVRIWKEIKKSISPRISEQELASVLDTSIRKRGYDSSFPTIAAFGENSAYPHAIPSRRKLRRDEHVLVDFGIRLKGYCSDLTRTWTKGRINRKIRELEKFVNIVHDRTIKTLKPGTDIGSAVKKANRFFADNKLGQYIRHGLGHGIGLNVHEIPFLREASRGRLKKGMVVTIEPGLYVPGVGGIRKEDMVLITAKGCEVLTQ